MSTPFERAGLSPEYLSMERAKWEKAESQPDYYFVKLHSNQTSTAGVVLPDLVGMILTHNHQEGPTLRIPLEPQNSLLELQDTLPSFRELYYSHTTQADLDPFVDFIDFRANDLLAILNQEYLSAQYGRNIDPEELKTIYGLSFPPSAVESILPRVRIERLNPRLKDYRPKVSLEIIDEIMRWNEYADLYWSDNGRTDVPLYFAHNIGNDLNQTSIVTPWDADAYTTSIRQLWQG